FDFEQQPSAALGPCIRLMVHAQDTGFSDRRNLRLRDHVANRDLRQGIQQKTMRLPIRSIAPTDDLTAVVDGGGVFQHPTRIGRSESVEVYLLATRPK